MTRDYAKSRARSKARNTRRKPPPPTTAPGWAWLLAGILLGALVTGLIRLGDTPAREATGEVADTEVDRQDSARPRFDFYTLLKESEVIVPDGGEEPPLVDTPERVPETPSAPDVVFMLQAGSFKSAGDADTQRARLLLLNMDASVETVTPRPGETWHRVLVGPFTSTRKLGEARATLSQNGIESIQLRRKQ